LAEVWWPNHVVAGEVVYPPGGTWGPRIQPAYQIVLLHSGSLDLTSDGQTYRFAAGETILSAPNRTDFFQFALDEQTHHSWITIFGPPLPHAWSAPLEPLPKAIPLSQRMHALVKEAIYWFHTKHMPQLMLSIGCHALHLFLQEANIGPHQRRDGHKAVYLAEQFIQRRYAEDITLADISRNALVSPEYLCRLFRKQVGCSPTAYLWQYRTLRALDLLSGTGLSVADIAAACGFKTQFHLHRRVKAYTGLAPTEYRKTRQGAPN
jgi:AraC-like DNA-binding protein